MNKLTVALALFPALAFAQADLVVDSITVPAAAMPGATIAVRAVLSNIGTGPAGSFKYTWFLSENTVVTGSDVRLAAPGMVASLAQQAMVTQNDSLTVPTGLAPRAYWLGVCVNYDPAAVPEFGIAEISQLNNCKAAPASIVVSTGQVAVVTQALPGATQYSPYGFRLQASGGDGAYTWSQTGGTLPPGLTLFPTGDLQGTPSSAGTFAFDVKVSSNGADANASLTMVVSPGVVALSVVDQDLPAAEFGRAYQAPLVALGGMPPYVWKLKADNHLPLGLNLSPDGRVVGSPTEIGDFLFGVVCTDAAGTAAIRDLKLRVVTPATLRIATISLPTGSLRQSYLQPLQAVGGKPGYDWTLVRFQQLAENATEQDGAALGNGKDPIPFPVAIGLQIEAGGNGTHFLRGTPKLAGLFLLSLKVVDNNGADDFAQLLLKIEYAEGLAITTTALPDAFVGHEYQARLSHNGGKDATVTFSVPCLKQATSSGMFICAAADPKQSMPAGLVLAADGSITGTPIGLPGNFAFLIKVSDETGRQDVRSLSIRIGEDFSLQPAGGCGCAGAGFDVSMLAAVVAVLGLRRRHSSR